MGTAGTSYATIADEATQKNNGNLILYSCTGRGGLDARLVTALPVVYRPSDVEVD